MHWRRRRGSGRDPRGPVERALAAGLAWARVGVGGAVWLAPRRSMRVLGFDAANPQLIALARLAGTRDLALGGAAVATLADPGAAAIVARLNALVDAGDALAFGLALLRREGIDRAGALGLASASAASAAGLSLARRYS